MCIKYTATYTDYCAEHTLAWIASAQAELVKRTMEFCSEVGDLRKHSIDANEKWWRKTSATSFYFSHLRGLSDELDDLNDAVEKAGKEYAKALHAYSLTQAGMAKNRAIMNNPRLPEDITEWASELHDKGLKYQKGVHRAIARSEQKASVGGGKSSRNGLRLVA